MKDKFLTWIILKLTQVCNLNCTYCYVYNRGDSSWKTRPAIISHDVINQLVKRINEHCERNNLYDFGIEFHGGEPLIIGIGRFREILQTITREIPTINLTFVIQTNGLLLTEEWVDLFEEYNVGIGISLDGPEQITDANRVDHMGRGITHKLLAIIKKLREYNPDSFSPGFCCVVNPTLIAGDELVRWFSQQEIDSYDLLLPDGNYINYPAHWEGAGSYSDFLISAFNEWFQMGARAPRIRKFEQMILGMFGNEIRLDSLGGDLKGICVVESDGGITVNDVARLCGGIFAKDELTIFQNTLDSHVTHFEIDELQELSDKCKSCRFLSSCGGGNLPHRFDGVSFKNPSIYCEALYNLSEHIYTRVKETLPESAVLQE
ncbi:MAG: radical SAM protein [Cyclobacteriaceae bacterium]